MPDPAEDADQIRRYQAIEQAYCENRWREVLREGEKLLDELTRSDGEETEGLEQRLQLLLAHTHLYGFADRDAAEDHYSSVLRSRADASLRQIASEGLARCNQPRMGSGEPTASAVDEPDIPTPEPADEPLATGSPMAFAQALSLSKEETESAELVRPAAPWESDTNAPAPEAATPWLQAAGTATPLSAELPRLVPEVLEEPEQIAVHQSLPELANERLLEPVEPAAFNAESEQGAGALPVHAGFLEEPAGLEELEEKPEEEPAGADALDAAMAPLEPEALNLPEPAADEDPELVRGLLRVLIH